MGKGRFVNQKLGKRVSRKFALLKSRLSAQGKKIRASPTEARQSATFRSQNNPSAMPRHNTSP